MGSAQTKWCQGRDNDNKGPQKDDALENQLYDILDKTGDAQAIRQMWGEYFSNEESERNKIAKSDAINDLVNYILEE